MAAPDDQPLFRARNLAKTYHTGEVTVRALHHVDLDIRRGEFIVLLGPGARQGTCRPFHAASGCIGASPACAATDSRSGFRVTTLMGVQSRVSPDHRRGFLARAWEYSS